MQAELYLGQMICASRVSRYHRVERWQNSMVRLSSFRILIERAMYHPAVTIPLSRFNGAEVKIEEMEGDDGS